MKKTFVLMAITTFFSTLAVLAQEPAMPPKPDASEGEIISLTGQNEQETGLVRIAGGPLGKVLTIEVRGLSEGWHGFHVHEIGDCADRETFNSAGGHAALPGQTHGFLNRGVPHAGDLPNIWVNETGAGKAQFFVMAATWQALQDTDGSAFVIHTQEDDFKTDPAGLSGTRVACGVIGPPKPRP